MYLMGFLEKIWVAQSLRITGFVGECIKSHRHYIARPDDIDRDSITATQGLIICPHPEAKNLFLATGGLFHAWKFFSVLGKVVVEMLEGNLSEEMMRRWAWDKHDQGSAFKGVVPHREMRDLF